jgi:hypothetical protein
MKIMRVKSMVNYSKTIKICKNPKLDNIVFIDKLKGCLKEKLKKKNLGVYGDKREIFIYNNYKHSTHTGQNILQIFNFIRKGKIELFESNKPDNILIKYEFSYSRIITVSFLFSFFILILFTLDKNLLVLNTLFYFLIIGFSFFSIIFFVIKLKIKILINDCLNSIENYLD